MVESCGQLADRYGRLNVLCPATVLSGLLYLVLWLPSTGAASLIVFACTYGFFSAVFILPTAFATLVIRETFVRHGTKEEYHNVVTFAGAMVLVEKLL